MSSFDRFGTFTDEQQGAARYLQAMRAHWLLITTFVVLAVGASLAYSTTAQKRYDASADVLITPVSSDDTTFIGVQLLRESSSSARSVLTAARLIATPQVADAVRARLHTRRSRRVLLGSVSVTPLEQSSIVQIGGEGDTAQAAADLANAFAETFIEQQTVRFQESLRSVVGRLRAAYDAIPPALRTGGEGVEIAQRLAQLRPLVGQPDPTVNVSSPAVAPDVQSWPRPALSTAVALIAALLLGTGLALALELVNPRVASEDELLLGHRLPILTRVPRIKRGAAQSALTTGEPLPGEVREAYRTLRASLAQAGSDGEFPSSVLVTSAIPGEGKTMTSVNLALTIAQTGARVILIDGDLRRPMVATVFGLAGRHHGFASLLTGESTAREALVPAPGQRGRLQLLLASPEHAHLIDLLERRRVEAVLDDLSLDADVIVIDSPPLTEVADALTLADAAHAVLLAVRMGRTRRDKLNELRRILARRGVAPVGFVLTTNRRSRRGGYYYGSDSGGRGRDPGPAEAIVAEQGPGPAEHQPEVAAAREESDSI
jgi:non-specific protein-tyrosine kinase